jgi:hypothetical protein
VGEPGDAAGFPGAAGEPGAAGVVGFDEGVLGFVLGFAGGGVVGASLGFTVGDVGLPVGSGGRGGFAGFVSVGFVPGFWRNDGGLGASMGRPGSFLPGVDLNAGGFGASMGRPGSFLPGVDPNPGGFGALIGSLGCCRPGVLRMSGGFGGAICRSFGERFIGAVPGALSRPRWIGGPGSRPSGRASGEGCSGLIGSDGSRWPGVESGVGSSPPSGCTGASGFRSGSCSRAGVDGLRGAFDGTAFGALGGVACAQAASSTPEAAKTTDRQLAASVRSSEDLFVGLVMGG